MKKKKKHECSFLYCVWLCQKLSDYRFQAELLRLNCFAQPVKSGLTSPGKHLNISASHPVHKEVNTES